MSNQKNPKDISGLIDAFTHLKGKDEIDRFLKDLCTPAELSAFAERWSIAKLLDEEILSYRDIAQQTGASTTTVARVSRFLKLEPHQGYKIVIDRLKNKNPQ